MQRQIVLDTETTGLRWQDEHRVIEIGCVEVVDRKLTGNNWHGYFQPQRDIDAGAQNVHGIDADFLADKPLLKDRLGEFLQYIKGAELIIHNAPFDVGFLDYELKQAGESEKTLADYAGSITDTLILAREKHPGRKNTLDALCQRYDVDASNRQLHGALLDAGLLAEVYLKMTAGQRVLFADQPADPLSVETSSPEVAPSQITERALPSLKVLPASEKELQAHRLYLQKMSENGTCLWE